MIRLVLLLFLVPPWAGAQTTPSPSATPYRPHASETSKPAVFGYMILARTADQLGTPVKGVYAQSVLPWLACGLIAPFYFRLSRRAARRAH